LELELKALTSGDAHVIAYNASYVDACSGKLTVTPPLHLPPLYMHTLARPESG